MEASIEIIERALQKNEITNEDAKSLKSLCETAEESVESLKTQLKDLRKACLKTENEILGAKVQFQKIKIQESEELQKVNKTDELRNIAHRDLEIAEHKEVVAKFELQEVKLAHDELRVSLENVQRETLNMIEPFLENLKEDNDELTNQISSTRTLVENEKLAIQHIENKIQRLEIEISGSSQILQSRKDTLSALESKPDKSATKHQNDSKIDVIEKSIQSLETELKILNKKYLVVEEESDKLVIRRFNVESLQKSVFEKVQVHRSTISKREQEIMSVKSNVEALKTENHELLTKKVENNLHRKEIDNDFRHDTSQLMLVKREYENALRQLKKKRKIFDQVKELLPTLQEKLMNEEIALKSRQEELLNKSDELNSLKEEIDLNIAEFTQQGGIEKEKKMELDRVVQDHDDVEEKVMSLVMESKSLSSIVQSLSAQRDKKSRDKSKIEGLLKESHQHSRVKELNVLDLTKRCNEMSNRLKEFLALYEIVKNERNKYINLIQGSTQALTEMKEKVRILVNEMEILSNESTAKDFSLTKEKNTHQSAKGRRDQLRHEMNLNMNIYKEKQAILETQILEIDKLNSCIRDVEKIMLNLKVQFEEVTSERNKIGLQLIERNDELTVLHEKSHQQIESLKKGEMELLKRMNELRLIKIQTEELKQKYSILVKRVPLKSKYSTKIEELEKKVTDEKEINQALSLQLESPENLERWRALDGDDPDVEVLHNKVTQLEKRVDMKRSEALEKQIVIDELTVLNTKLQNQIDSKSASSGVLSLQLHEVQAKLKDLTRKMMATVSELSMYQSNALQLQQEKDEKQKVVEAATEHVTRGEPPSDEAVRDWIRLEKRMIEIKTKLEQTYSTKQNPYNTIGNASNGFMDFEQTGLLNASIKTTAEPRPTAYIPDDVLGVPKPYGNLAPFKPSTLGTSMRHIRNPIPKPIEM